MTTAHINLYTPSLLPQRPLLPAAWLPAVVGLALGCCLLLALWTQGQLAQAQARVQQVRGQLAPLQAQVAQARALVAARKADPVLEAEVKRLEQVVSHQARAIQVLQERERGASMPFSTPMEALARQGRPGLWLTRVAWSPQVIELDGRAQDVNAVPLWLAGLRDEPVLGGRSFQVLDLSRPEPAGSAAAAPALAASAPEADRPGRDASVTEPMAHRFRLRTEPLPAEPVATPQGRK